MRNESTNLIHCSLARLRSLPANRAADERILGEPNLNPKQANENNSLPADFKRAKTSYLPVKVAERDGSFLKTREESVLQSNALARSLALTMHPMNAVSSSELISATLKLLAARSFARSVALIAIANRSDRGTDLRGASGGSLTLARSLAQIKQHLDRT